MIKFGIRQSFDNIEQVEERYSKLDVPVELALPYYWNIYEPVRGRLTVQAPITDERFKIWGNEIADFARALGATNITLHPNNVNKDKAIQDEALNNLEYFSGLYKNDVVFCIETFEGKRRVFAPDEIALFNLPMTLDTSHIREDEKVWSLIKGYKERIFNMHLSAREGARQHLPIDDFCKEVVRYLIDNKWTGNVILEYLPEFHGHLLNDLGLLKAMQ